MSGLNEVSKDDASSDGTDCSSRCVDPAISIVVKDEAAETLRRELTAVLEKACDCNVSIRYARHADSTSAAIKRFWELSDSNRTV